MAIKPPCAWLSLTRDCDQNCRWCYESHQRQAGTYSMNLGKAIQNIENMAALGINEISLLGGEPTLYPHLAEVARRAKQLGMTTYLITNGRNVGKPEFLPAMEYLDGIGFTIYSLVNPKTHNLIARTDSWHETMEGMRQAAIADKLSIINLVVGEANYLEIIPTLEQLLDWGLLTFMSCAMPRYDRSGKIDGAEALNPIKYAGLVKACYDQFGANPSLQVVYELPLCLLDKDVYRALSEAHCISTSCKINDKRLVLSTDSKVIPCSVMPQKILAEKVEGTSEFLAQWRETISEVSHELLYCEQCQGCSLKAKCHAGCPIAREYWQLEDVISPIK